MKKIIYLVCFASYIPMKLFCAIKIPVEMSLLFSTSKHTGFLVSLLMVDLTNLVLTQIMREPRSKWGQQCQCCYEYF